MHGDARSSSGGSGNGGRSSGATGGLPVERDLSLALLSAAVHSSRAHLLCSVEALQDSASASASASASGSPSLKPGSRDDALRQRKAAPDSVVTTVDTAVSQVREALHRSGVAVGGGGGGAVHVEERLRFAESKFRLEPIALPAELANAGGGLGGGGGRSAAGLPGTASVGGAARLSEALAFRFVQTRAAPDRFAERQREFGSDYCFHGSALCNWWSIACHGLSRKFDRGDGVFGPGIYLTTKPEVADQFVQLGQCGWAASRFARGKVGVVGGFEVIKDPSIRREVNDGKYIVVSDPSAIRLRHLYVVIDVSSVGSRTGWQPWAAALVGILLLAFFLRRSIVRQFMALVA